MGYAPPMIYGQNPSGKSMALQCDSEGRLIMSPADDGAGNTDQTALHITAATVVKGGTGLLLGLMVTVAGTAAGTANDAASTGAASASNTLAALPNTVGSVPLPQSGIPFANGLVIEPGSGQTVVAIYR